MNTCIFCDIVSGKIPSHKIYEDRDFIAFLDIRPLSAGHSLIIPKKHYRFVWDVPNAGEYFLIAQRIARATQKAFDTEFVFSKIFGEEVSHAHIWIYPDPESAGQKGLVKTNFEIHKNKLISELASFKNN